MKKYLIILVIFLSGCISQKEIVTKQITDTTLYNKYYIECIGVAENLDERQKEYYKNSCSKEAQKYSVKQVKYIKYKKFGKIIEKPLQ